MNIAILIGVSEYNVDIQDLPGTKNDIKAVKKLIEKTGKYKNILPLGNESSSHIKDELAKFINDQKGNKIEEVFFYFSGHGDFSNDEFYYILSDFQSSKKKQTSLQNSELDNMLKALSPSLVTKVVDACHSGTSYIKDIKAIDTYIKSTSSKFENCYFLYSSLESQSSYQDSNYSFFTLSFLNAIKSFKETDIRYKNVIDFISDEFSTFPEQTPFFVTQADFTEIFCSKTSDLIKFIKTIPDTFPEKEEEKIVNEESEKIKTFSLLDIVKAEAKEYVTQDELNNLLDEIKNKISNFKLKSDFSELFEIKVDSLSYAPVNSNFITIGRFLTKNSELYFANPQYTTETYEEKEEPSGWEAMTNPYARAQTVTKTKEVLVGYELVGEYSFVQLHIDINSKYPSLSSYHCPLIFLPSDNRIKFYYFVSNYIKLSWEQRKINSRYEWINDEFKLIDKESIMKFIDGIFRAINQRIKADLSKDYKEFLKE